MKPILLGENHTMHDASQSETHHAFATGEPLSLGRIEFSNFPPIDYVEHFPPLHNSSQ